jgi:hypothetical protein
METTGNYIPDCIVSYPSRRFLWNFNDYLKCKVVTVTKELGTEIKAHGHLLEVSGQFHAPAALPSKKEPPGIHWTGGWVDPRGGLDDSEKGKFLTLPGLELRYLCRPTRSQSLYRLRYPSTRLKDVTFIVMRIITQTYFFIHRPF